MDLPRALSLLRDTVSTSSQVRLARRIGVSNGTVSRWIKGDVTPTGEKLEKLMAWAAGVEETQHERAQAAAAIPAAVVLKARQIQSETHRDLARIYGYAESIADLADQVSSKQRGLLEMLKPWVDTETDVRAGKIEGVLAALERMDAMEAGQPDATLNAGPGAPPAAARRKKRSAG